MNDVITGSDLNQSCYGKIDFWPAWISLGIPNFRYNLHADWLSHDTVFIVRCKWRLTLIRHFLPVKILAPWWCNRLPLKRNACSPHRIFITRARCVLSFAEVDEKVVRCLWVAWKNRILFCYLTITLSSFGIY